MVVRPARCDRSRESISLRLDGMLSTFEGALLDRHLRRCADCRSFAAAATSQTRLLRDAPLEQPLRPVELPVRTASPFRRGSVGALSAVVAAAAAALVVLSPATDKQGGAQLGATAARATGRTVLVVYPAKLQANTRVDMPRLRVQPASIADGPVHGYFSIPV